MTLRKLLLATLFTALASVASAQTDKTAMTTKTLSWSELEAMPYPARPGTTIPYGASAAKFGELRLPDRKRHGKGSKQELFPVLILVHGGCWQAEYDYAYFTRLAAWFTEQGVATWTIEYRRLGDGGGWPNTFMDVGEAADSLHLIARTDPLDLQRVYAVGHSAGGQLALWLASRGKLPNESELARTEPLKIRGVLGLAAITDLASYRVGPAGSCNASVDQLLGGTPETVARRYAETSPLARLPLGVPQVFVQGELDPIVPAAGVRAYVEAATKAGDAVTLLTLPTAGHFEPSVPHPASEAALKQALQILLKAP
ncbi:MAG: alpha/beta hydrolase [Stagnimonas sp.]|nr:alpha/beta hydrolase [Stagnimonas sp.]